MLFRTSEEIKKYLPQNASFEFSQIEPFIRFNGEPELIIPAISQAQYDLLDLAYTNNVMTEALTALLDKVRYPLANYAYVKYLPFAQLTISASGIHIEVNEQRKTAFEWQINKLERGCNENAENGIEQLLVFLESKKTTYPLWAASDSCTEFKECFINTTTEFERYFSIGKSRSTFLSLKPLMIRMEAFKIKPILGSTLFDAIKTEIKSGIISVSNKLLLDFIKPGVAHFTVAQATIELPLKYMSEGIQIIEENSRINPKGKAPAPVTQLAALEMKSTATAQTYVQQLQDFLYANATNYPDWMNSGNYITPDSDSVTKWDQTKAGVAHF